ncbi:SRPBCC domain-containing protein [Pyxidicoccus sp. 3LG]
MTRTFNPELDLTLSRIIKAPRLTTWRAFAEPALFEQWWLPAPMKMKVIEMALRPGGALHTDMLTAPGKQEPHLRACYLDVTEGREVVFTTALAGGWRPVTEFFLSLTAILTLEDHPQGTRYTAHVMHSDAAARQKHVDLGFEQGWGTVANQLVSFAEQLAAHR